MTELVQIGSAPANPLVPQTTLPDLLCHTITDKELDVLTDRSATVVGGICTASFGVVASSAVGALPTAQAVLSGSFDGLHVTDVAHLLLFVSALPIFLLTMALAAHHLWKRKRHAADIRARPKMPMRMRAANQR